MKTNFSKITKAIAAGLFAFALIMNLQSNFGEELTINSALARESTQASSAGTAAVKKYLKVEVETRTPAGTCPSEVVQVSVKTTCSASPYGVTECVAGTVTSSYTHIIPCPRG